MPQPDRDRDSAIERAAGRVAERMREADAPAFDALTHDAAFEELLQAVARLDDRFAFDRAGRPGAAEAVRQALPIIERDLFEAILDDCACELAATREALCRVVLAYGRLCRTGD